METSRHTWVDEEMVFRRAAIKDTRMFEVMPDRISPEESDEEAVIEERFMNLPHPRYWQVSTRRDFDDPEPPEPFYEHIEVVMPF